MIFSRIFSSKTIFYRFDCNSLNKDFVLFIFSVLSVKGKSKASASLSLKPRCLAEEGTSWYMTSRWWNREHLHSFPKKRKRNRIKNICVLSLRTSAFLFQKGGKNRTSVCVPLHIYTYTTTACLFQTLHDPLFDRRQVYYTLSWRGWQQGGQCEPYVVKYVVK